MFKRLYAKVQIRLEQFAKWQACDYLNRGLAERIGEPRDTPFEWSLYGEDATWRRLMDGDNHDRIVAVTRVLHSEKQVTVGGWFSYGELISLECPPPIFVHTEVLKGPMLFTSDWERQPAQFDSPATFAQQVLRC